MRWLAQHFARLVSMWAFMGLLVLAVHSVGTSSTGREVTGWNVVEILVAFFMIWVLGVSAGIEWHHDVHSNETDD
jgi:hypothetical protein